jgi:hypothetical protein
MKVGQHNSVATYKAFGGSGVLCPDCPLLLGSSSCRDDEAPRDEFFKDLKSKKYES